MIDLDQLHRDSFDWTMRDGPRPHLLEDGVDYDVTCRDRTVTTSLTRPAGKEIG